MEDKFNKEQLNWRTIDYVAQFLEEVNHLKNRIKVKTVVAKIHYGSILSIKIYRYKTVSGTWERHSNSVFRVKCDTDLVVLQSSLHHYLTILKYMYENIIAKEKENDSD